jgi:lysozyme
MHGRHRAVKVRHVTAKGCVSLLAVCALATPSVAYADAGFDNASYQGCYDASTAKANGASFSITKLTEGPGYDNPYAGCQIGANRSAGLRMAAYDFARPDLYGAYQSADHFNATAESLGLVHAGVIPVLDWEPSGGMKRDVKWAYDWLARVESYWGTKPLIYMSASTIAMADWSGVANADYGLWVAGYPRGYEGERLRNPGAPPYDLGPWPFAAAWQYSSSGNVPGVGNAVDVDWFYGDAVTWAKYANATPGTSNNPDTSTTTPADGAPTADVDTLATEVIRGVYGNDPQRRRLLGSRYDEVMALVNTRMGGVSPDASGAYYVKPGDYLSKIWPHDWRRVAGLNGITWPYTIYPGERLVTDSGVQPSGGRVWWVHHGDTLSSIASYLGVPVSSIHGYRSGDPNLIYPGEALNY